MYKTIRVPVIGWRAVILNWDLGESPRWGYTRGRCEERELRMSFRLWRVILRGRGKRYRDLVGLKAGKGYIDWVIDEFDASFNELACATLRYHMDYSVALCGDERRVTFQHLIDRLSEEEPEVCDTPEKEAIFATHDPFETGEDLGVWLMRGTPLEMQAIFDDYTKRELEYEARIDQARHDFVDIMRHLWS